MPKVKNTQLRGRSVSTRGQIIHFGADGIAEVSPETAERLSRLPGYVVVEDVPAQEVATEVTAEVVDAVVQADKTLDDLESRIGQLEEDATNKSSKTGKKGRKSASSDKE